MATGRYGAYDLIGGVKQSLCQGETDRYTAVTVSLVNRRNDNVKVSIAISTNVNDADDADFIDKDVELYPKTVLERTGIAIKAGQYITVESDKDLVSAVAYGVESGAAVSVTPIPTNTA